MSTQCYVYINNSCKQPAITTIESSCNQIPLPSDPNSAPENFARQPLKKRKLLQLELSFDSVSTPSDSPNNKPPVQTESALDPQEIGFLQTDLKNNTTLPSCSSPTFFKNSTILSNVNSQNSLLPENISGSVYAASALPESAQSSSYIDKNTFTSNSLPEPISSATLSNHSQLHLDNAATLTSTKNIYTCKYCNKSYAKPSKLEEHIRTHTGERPYKCMFPGCDKAYMRLSHLTVHTRSHDDKSERKYKCSIEGCNASFNTNQHLKRHISSHNNEKPYKCTFEGCNQSFSKHNLLHAHLCKHNGTNPYKCTFENCGKSFTTPSKLKAHEQTHNLTPKYMCGYSNCFSKFTKLVDLKAHIKESHKLLDLECPVCNKKFSRNDVLKDHMQTHQQDRQIFSCSYPGCNRFYYKESSVNTHIRSFHQNIKPFVCNEPNCDMAFSRKHLLVRHKKIHVECNEYPVKKRVLLKTVEKSFFFADSNDSVDRLGDTNMLDQASGKNHANMENTLGDRISIKKPVFKDIPTDANSTRPVNKERVDQMKRQFNMILGRNYQNPAFSNRPHRCPVAGCIFQFKRQYDLSRHIKKDHKNFKFGIV
ncbi:hypothetical protein BB561_000279 [Smittium simulii]|uniref:C2H2-type domain-containing protein n=1 Tax=Smittium simulii TaxID=133385 RepID=A0A2T9YZZ4_9FUNG|nr:hypothetical protein BB561_000279 [Smittium simulii]